MKVDSSSNPSVMLIWIQHQVSVYVQTFFFKSNVLRFSPKNNDCYYGNNRVLIKHM